MSQQLAGVLPIAHTPFLDDQSIDEPSLARQIEWAYQQGADGCCTGMVSELLRLTPDERQRLTTLLAELNRGRGCFVASVGAESTRQAVQYCQQAVDAGADAVMAIPPLSTSLSDAQLTGYFAALATESGVPLIVQDASSYVGQPIPHTICLELLERFGAERILFKPEAAPLGPNLSALRDATDGRGSDLRGLRRDLVDRQLSPRRRRHHARHGIPARHRGGVEGAAVGRRRGRLPRVLSRLRTGGAATAGRPGRVPCHRKVRPPQARPIRHRRPPHALPVGAGRRDTTGA